MTHLLTFVHISDTHLHLDPTHTETYIEFASKPSVEQLIDAVNALEIPVDFVMHTGDIAHSPETDAHYATAREVLSKLRYPVYYAVGNHDSPPMFQRAFLQRDADSITPHYDYTFEVNGVQIVMLDSHAPEGEHTASGHMSEAQLAWLDALCSAHDPRPMVVGLHHHTLPVEAPWLDTMVLTNGLDLHGILLKAKQRLRGVFYGHIHETIVTTRDGITYYSVQSGWFQTRTWYGQANPARDLTQYPGFNLVTLTDRDTFVRPLRVPAVL